MLSYKCHITRFQTRPLPFKLGYALASHNASCYRANVWKTLKLFRSGRRSEWQRKNDVVLRAYLNVRVRQKNPYS